MLFHAHSANAVGIWHPLFDHLTSVSRLAREFASATPWADEACLSGLLHDIGKYGDLFQARLRGQASGLDHWSTGAQLALLQHRAVAACLAIEGHHIGLQRGNKDALRRLLPEKLRNHHSLGLTLSDENTQRLKERAFADGIELIQPTSHALTNWERDVATMLDVRVLFSCLVDADFLDTEAHFEADGCGKRYRRPGPKLNAQAALDALLVHIQRVQSRTKATGPVAETRQQLLAACLDSASAATGHYTLTAPTGSGKTLAMLAFALAHAAKHGLKRVILAVPFLSIIEQTACIYRSIFTAHPQFGEGYVLEHHSMAGMGAERHTQDNEGADNEPSHEERQRRLLAQNWDAPIILTTNVQLLESLFSNRPGACRKLHNLMESVILFDEAQSLPQSLAVPTLAALSHLSTAYRSTVVFATATQPAFDTLDEAVKKHAVSGWKPGQIVEDHAPMFKALKRVEIAWPGEGKETSWDELAGKLRAANRALCVVNLKRHALILMDTLAGEESVFHLSTNLCPEHRRAVLDAVRKRLTTVGLSCRLISTQCVEAGVDVDFPEVFRAFAPLDAIAQAAGRCNREGLLSGIGTVTVFDPEEEGSWRRRYPTFAYYQAAQVTRTMLATNGHIDINAPEVFREYYRRLYDLSNQDMLDTNLALAIQSLDFPAIAQRYRLIEKDAIQVLVPYSSRQASYDELRREEENKGINGEWMRRAQGLAVSIYRPAVGHPAWSVLIPANLRWGGVSDEWFILESPQGGYYDNDFGLRLPDSDPIFIA